MPDESASRRTVGELVAEASRRLRAAGIADAHLDATILAGAALGLDRTRLRLDAREIARDGAAAELLQLLDRREAGEPVHRILGRRAFYAHEFELSAETLEPRPDTEILVDLAAEALRAREEADEAVFFADLGTGTGAIAVSLLALFPKATALAVDISPGALFTARRNAAHAGVASRFLPLAGDFLASVGTRLDMVVSNPPYIISSQIEELAREVRDHDPRMALDGGADGLSAYRAIMRDAMPRVKTQGDLLLEIGAGQADEVCRLAADAGFLHVRTAHDLAGIERALWFRRDGGEK